MNQLKKLGQANVRVVENGEDFIAECMAENGGLDLDLRTDLFDTLTKNFSKEVGSIESRLERS